MATRYFSKMKEIISEDKIDPYKRKLFGATNIHYGQHLRSVRKVKSAREIVEQTLKMSIEQTWQEDQSRCHQFLGDLDANIGHWDNAQIHFREAVGIARRIKIPEVLVEALLGRGQGSILRGTAIEAQNDLEEALDYAVDSGYRILEADIRIGLAKVFQAAGDYSSALDQVEMAQRMSSEMGYYWGVTEAETLLASLPKSTSQS
jgi:tetratricopeptide (TPR) repeat protein